MSQTQTGKPLLIPDHLPRLVPFVEENIFSSGSNTKLLLMVGNKKPKPSSILVEQYSVANLCIFFELLPLNCLPTLVDIREYFSYSIKIHELAKKYFSGSVLQYDNEFRILQYTGGHPWSMNHSHIHDVNSLLGSRR